MWIFPRIALHPIFSAIFSVVQSAFHPPLFVLRPADLPEQLIPPALSVAPGFSLVAAQARRNRLVVVVRKILKRAHTSDTFSPQKASKLRLGIYTRRPITQIGKPREP